MTLTVSRLGGTSYPMWRFLAGSDDRFRDFFVQIGESQRIEQVAFQNLEVFRGVFPGAILLYGHLGGAVGLSLGQSLVVYNLIVVLVLTVGACMAFRQYFVRLFVLTSFPVMFGFLRGNNEILTFGLFLIGTSLIQRNLWKSGFVVALVGQLIEPNLFFVLLKKLFSRSGVLLLLLISCVLATTSSLFTGSASPTEIISDSIRFTLTQSQGGGLFGLLHNVSLPAAIGGWRYVFGETSSLTLLSVSLESISEVLTLVMIVLVIVAFIPLFQIHGANREIVVACLLLLAPMYSFPYRTIWLLVPLGHLLDTSRPACNPRFRPLQVALILSLIIPKGWFVWSQPSIGVEFHEGTLIDPVITTVLLAVTFLQPWTTQHKNLAKDTRVKLPRIRK